MRTLFIVSWLLMLAACRFDQPIPASLDLDTKGLIGDWKAKDGKGRVIISDLRFGRVRMLLKENGQGMILDGHVIKLDDQRYLQTHIIAMIGAKKEILPLPNTRWMVWKLDIKDKVMTVRAARKIPFSGDTDKAILASAKQALTDTKNFDSAREWQWVGSDKPAKL